MKYSLPNLRLDLKTCRLEVAFLRPECQPTSTGGAEPLKVAKYGDHLSFTYFRNTILAEC